MPSYQNRLFLHEWWAVACFVAILLTLGVISYASVESPSLWSSQEETSSPPVLIQVYVDGAVEHPGIYSVSNRDSVASLLEQVKPLPQADLAGLDRSVELKDGQTIRLSEVKMLKVFVTGAVLHEGAMEVRQGTRLQDLITLGVCQEGANIQVLNKKRKLKEGEMIHVPFKKISKSKRLTCVKKNISQPLSE